MTPSSPALRVSGLTKSFGGPPVLDDVSLCLDPGKCVGVLGPSGCGKTTLLRIVAGLETADRGQVEIGGTVTDDPKPRVPPEKRDVGLIFQDLALWPHMSVRRNLTFVMESRGRSKGQRGPALNAAIDAAGLPASLLDRRPGELSGGERQRAAFARALVQEPRVLLLDEPLTGLDRDLRHHLVATLRRLLRDRGVTMLLVTHDQSEAFALADEVVVLDSGRVAQRGVPAQVYARPASRFVAEFVGMASCVPVQRQDGLLVTAVGQWPDGDIPDGDSFHGGAPDGPLVAVLRPESLRLSDVPPHGDTGRPGTVEDRYYQGGHWMHVVRVCAVGSRIDVLVRSLSPRPVGSQVEVTADRPAFVPADGSPVATTTGAAPTARITP